MSNKFDPAWIHCSPLKAFRNGTICKFCCKMICGGGIARFKQHLAGINGRRVSPCVRVPESVRDETVRQLSSEPSPAMNSKKSKEYNEGSVKEIKNFDDLKLGKTESEKRKSEDIPNTRCIRSKTVKNNAKKASTNGDADISKGSLIHCQNECADISKVNFVKSQNDDDINKGNLVNSQNENSRSMVESLRGQEPIDPNPNSIEFSIEPNPNSNTNPNLDSVTNGSSIEPNPNYNSNPNSHTNPNGYSIEPKLNTNTSPCSNPNSNGSSIEPNPNSNSNHSSKESCVEPNPKCNPKRWLFLPDHLPFEKNPSFWQIIETLEISMRTPQRPHFKGLESSFQYTREGEAILLMTSYINITNSIQKLSLNDSLETIEEIILSLDSLEFEQNGLNIDPLRTRLMELFVIKSEINELQPKLAKQERDLDERESGRERVRVFDKRIDEVQKKIGDLKIQEGELVGERERELSLIDECRERKLGIKNWISKVDSARERFARVSAKPLWD